ncbi:hypothetical protein E4H12_04245 [Candidatus Thorarchaeota archaeon]|nr:MAG: hypothetical protein E4H12_04245 [Candidatus Thorarchaeota archaeon]
MEDALQKSTLIITKAKENGATLRLIGGLAFRQHCRELDFCEREYGDIDLVGLSSEAPIIIKTLIDLGYKENARYTLTSGGTRFLFEKFESKDHVDIFLDKLRMEHDIDLRQRLSLEEFTISVSDLLVCKLIILNFNEKDYRDIITIVKDLDIGEDDLPSTINMDYIGRICSRNWGLYHDVTNSIDECIEFIENYHLEEEVAQKVVMRFNAIRKAIDQYPKSGRWKFRRYIGESYPWRKTVELERVER